MSHHPVGLWSAEPGFVPLCALKSEQKLIEAQQRHLQNGLSERD